MKAFRLPVRPVRAADVDALVPVESQPPQVFQDARFRLASCGFENPSSATEHYGDQRLRGEGG